ncbi:MAG: hypothetical protein HY760_06660, partial [Nitrospirae bacterium]|nr:hypothetical protein [Nitrospirota bacterium]
MKRYIQTIAAGGGLLIGLLFFSPEGLYGFGSQYTHPRITEEAVSLLLTEGWNETLRRQWGLSQGLETVVRFSSGVEDGIPDGEITRNNQVIGRSFQRQRPTFPETPYSLRYLLVSGSEAEDHPTERAQHHFHDPVSDSGLDNNVYGVGTLADWVTLLYPPARQGDAYRVICASMDLCEPTFHLDGTSAQARARGATSSAYPENYFAWPQAREFLYRGLTGRTAGERDHYFALAFFALGHGVHLLEDMGVPAHVRNDFLWDHIWSGVLRGSYLEGFVENPEGLPPASPWGVRPAFPGLADFWDNEGRQSLPGLAEYVNRNFLSEGTVFRKYAQPSWTG